MRCWFIHIFYVEKKKARESRNCNSKSEIVNENVDESTDDDDLNKTSIRDMCNKSVAAFQSIFICMVILGAEPQYVDLKSIPESRNKSWRKIYCWNLLGDRQMLGVKLI